MSEPRVSGILMLITGAFLLIPSLMLGIASIIIIPIPSFATAFLWALTLIVVALAVLNIGAGALLLSRPGDEEVRTLGIVVSIINLIFTWWTIIGAVLAVLELAFLL
ncbi:MAG: hypothetical protein RXR10_06485 [Vulcanisaeta sp.]|jgi:hypothetical protein|nr:hypothetical protein [Vulcanisaeta sp.]